MAEPFKNLLSASTVTQMGQHLQRAWPGFDRQHFESLAGNGLDALEMKARAMQLADALEASLPPDFAHAADVIEASLGAAVPLDADGEPVALTTGNAGDGLSGWAVWPLGEFIARRGLHERPRALACLHALTQRFSAEFAIRPFLRDHPQETLATLAVWTHDSSAHVRRLVSEGSRPRLPWGLRLQALVVDPTPTLPLLNALQDDASAYVRRSVANHLNDIAKDHPDLVARWVREHLRGASAERTTLLRHASRGLIKAGHAATLAAWGLQQGLQGNARLRLGARQAAIGEELSFEVSLTSTSDTPQALVVDYIVHSPRASGKSSAKVFKGWKLNLAAGETRLLRKRHSLRPVTTRPLLPGAHRIELQVNGAVVAHASFTLQAGASPD